MRFGVHYVGPGAIPIVRNRLAIMKLTNTPPTDAVTPNADGSTTGFLIPMT
jgi:hypothetical protein